MDSTNNGHRKNRTYVIGFSNNGPRNNKPCHNGLHNRVICNNRLCNNGPKTNITRTIYRETMDFAQLSVQ